MDNIFENLKQKNVYRASQQEIDQILNNYTIEKEVDTHMTGPIKILTINDLIDQNKKLAIESDQKNQSFIRFIDNENIQEFIDERLSVYDKMWDGCGCKVFYDEVWIPVNKVKDIKV